MLPPTHDRALGSNLACVSSGRRGLGWFWCYGSYGTRFCPHTYNRTYKSNWSCCHRNHGIQYWKSVLYCSAHHDADTHHSIVLIFSTGAHV